MHFREVGRRIQVIRTIYDPKLKRGVQTMLLSFPSRSLEPPAGAKKVLSLAELNELETWLARRRQEVERANRGTSYRQIVDDSMAAAGYVAEAEVKELSPQYAAKVHEATKALAEALVEAGFGKKEAAAAAKRIKRHSSQKKRRG